MTTQKIKRSIYIISKLLIWKWSSQEPTRLLGNSIERETSTGGQKHFRVVIYIIYEKIFLGIFTMIFIII